MADAIQPSRENVRALARLAILDLPDDRLDQLVTTFAAYRESLARLRQIDPRDHEPPAITYTNEAHA